MNTRQPLVTVQTGNFMAPYGYLENELRDQIPTFFDLEVKYRNIKDYRDAIDHLIERYQDHKLDPDVQSGLKSINNYSIVNSDKNKTILIKVNQNDHISSQFPISDILRVYIDTSIYKVMSYEELLERLNETGTLQLKDIRKSKVNNMDSQYATTSGINISEEIHELEEQYNREVNTDMEENRDQWEAIMNLAENQEDNLDRQADESSDIQIKLDVIGNLLEDIRDDLKEQEKRQLGLTSNIKSDKFNSISRFDNTLSGKPALVLLSSDKTK